MLPRLNQIYKDIVWQSKKVNVFTRLSSLQYVVFLRQRVHIQHMESHEKRQDRSPARALWKLNTRERTKQYQLPVGSFLQHTANAIAISARLLHACEKLAGPSPRILKSNNTANAADTKANAANTISPIVMLQMLHIIYLLILVGCGLLLLVSLTLRCS